jgi:hypothetical protein
VNVLVRAEARPAGLKAQQAQKPTVGADDSGPPPGCDHRPAHFGKAGPGRHCAACKSSQRHSGSIKADRVRRPAWPLDAVAASRTIMFVLDIARLDAASAEALEEPVGAPVFLMQGAVQDDTAQCLVAVSSHDRPAYFAFRQISVVRSGLRSIYWPESAAAMSSRMRAGGKCCS